ncbi:MAG: acetyl-CoA carboxylase carboxyl transferase subunit alpha, partial [Ignavibacteriaceae bacterium]|nr:acetyl-CoA carboxylase carboxyl transferase subunit alpha [Ignavibacteriaceae bacterium]
MGKTILDFEKPVFELEQKLEEMKKSSNRLGIEKEISRIESKVAQLKEELYK